MEHFVITEVDILVLLTGNLISVSVVDVIDLPLLYSGSSGYSARTLFLPSRMICA